MVTNETERKHLVSAVSESALVALFGVFRYIFLFIDIKSKKTTSYRLIDKHLFEPFQNHDEPAVYYPLGDFRSAHDRTNIG